MSVCNKVSLAQLGQLPLTQVATLSVRRCMVRSKPVVALMLLFPASTFGQLALGEETGPNGSCHNLMLQDC